MIIQHSISYIKSAFLPLFSSLYDSLLTGKISQNSGKTQGNSGNSVPKSRWPPCAIKTRANVFLQYLFIFAFNYIIMNNSNIDKKYIN